MKLPDASHPITITPAQHRICVRFAGNVVADTRRALALKEASYPVVYYIPRADVDAMLLAPSQHSTECPYKGRASYYSIATGDRISTNAIWSYETPYPAVAQIAGHMAFYPQRVDSIETLPLA